MNSGVRISIDRLHMLFESVETLTQNEVLVGIPGDVPLRTMPGGGAPAHPLPTNATLGYIHEFGSPAANIPARPFLRPGVSGAQEQLGNRLRAGAMAALTFPPDEKIAMTTLMGAGLIAQNAVRRYLNAGVSPPLAAATLLARRSRKIAPRKGTKPLIDTGQLRNSITFVIRPKGSSRTIARGNQTP